MVDVRVTGANEVAASFARLAEQVEELDSLQTAGERTRDELQSLSPRLTGRLSQSWQVTRVGPQVVVGSDLVYASVQNYGGYHGITGTHYVQQAAEAATGEIERLVTDELDRLISRLN